MNRALLPFLASCLLLTAAYGCEAKKEEAKDEASAKEDAKGKEAEEKKVEPEADTKAEATADAEAAAAPAGSDDTKGLGHLAHEKGHLDEKAEGDAGAEGDASPAPHLAVEKAKNDGALAHAATAVAHSEALPAGDGKEAMLKVAHEEEVDPTDEQLCKHVLSVLFDELGSELDDATKKDLEEDLMAECPEEVAKERVKLGPTLFQEAADCFMAAKSIEELDACDAAEEEAEEELHTHPTGDGLSKETCTEFYDHFAKLALDELGDLEGIKETMDDIEEDLIEACMDHGTKKEIECAMKAKSITELEKCE